MTDDSRKPGAAISRPYTTKQMSDACEMMVAAELTLAGVPALKVPDNWPGYDVIAQPSDAAPQRISVKARTFKHGAAYVGYMDYDQFDWLAIVLLGRNMKQDGGRAIYLIPRADTDRLARRDRPTAKTLPNGISEWIRLMNCSPRIETTSS